MVDVCIIGGGIGGLCTAIFLQRMGLDVIVCERDECLGSRKQGYGLTLTKNNCGPLAKLGVLEECITQNCLSSSHYLFAPNGKILGYYGRSLASEQQTKAANSGGNIGNLRIPRQDLRCMLLKLLKPSTMQWGCRFNDYIETDDCVETEICCGERIRKIKSSILVGADGIRSHVRRCYDIKHKIVDSQLRYLGVSVIIGLSTSQHFLSSSRGYYVVDGTHRLFTMPYLTHEPDIDALDNDGDKEKKTIQNLTMWQLSFSGLTEDESRALLQNASYESLMNEARKRTKGWFHAVSDLIENTISTEIWGTPLYDRDAMLLKKKHQGSRVTFLGDAAHPMSMFKGQGANQVLEDGPLLAYWLSDMTNGSNGNNNNNNNNSDKKKKSRREFPAGNDSNNHSENSNSSNNDSNIDTDVVIANTNENDVGNNKRKSHSDNNNNRKSHGICNRYTDKNTIYTRLRCFEREMIARTSPKVLASRQAAEYLHSVDVLKEQHGIEGISHENMIKYDVIQQLDKEGINANCNELIDIRLKEFVENNINNKI